MFTRSETNSDKNKYEVLGSLSLKICDLIIINEILNIVFKS